MHIERVQGVLGLSQNVSWCAKDGNIISGINLIFLFTFVKTWVLLIQNSMYYEWMLIEEIPEYKFYDNIRKLSIRSFRYHSNDTKRNLLGYVAFTLSN